jgi:SAM-dependent methyltransferase
MDCLPRRGLALKAHREGSMTDRAQHYHSVWKSYWGSLSGDYGEAFWDCDPAFGAAIDVPHFAGLVDRGLPLIDVGCGNGTQTRYLGQHFERVIGVDVSEEAVAHAARTNVAPSVEYRAMDVLRPEQARVLHDELGDANVYVRAVLHTFLPPDRPPAVVSLRTLLGKRGTLFLVELAPAALEYFQVLATKYGAPPPKLAKVLQHGITPATFSAGDVDTLFGRDRFRVIGSGEGVIRTTHALPDGGYAEVPTIFRILMAS